MGRPKRTLEQCQERANSMGGECLSTDYHRSSVKMTWKCAKGHVWQATADSVVGHNKSWCSHCAVSESAKRRSYTLDDCHALALTKGGWCLSKKYESSKSKLIWKCACGHVWSTSYNAVHNGTWCVICANERKRQESNLGIEKMHALAARQYGRCISDKYDNVNTLLEWECSEGHRFNTAACNVIAGSWCPTCSKGLSERLCRAIFEYLYGLPFPSRRPTWLRNVTGHAMELDGYCEALSIAFEYQGIQHYKPVIKFKLDEQRLNAVQIRDQIKVRICESNNVTLIQIPYTVTHYELETFVRTQLSLRGKALKHWNQLGPLNIWQMNTRISSRFSSIKIKGQEKKMECLSKSYLGAKTPLQWRCSVCDHEFKFSPYRLTKVIKPCNSCRKKTNKEFYEQQTLNKIRDYLNSRGESLLSKKFIGQNEPLELLCSQGHEWSTSWASLRHGTTCKVCRALQV